MADTPLDPRRSLIRRLRRLADRNTLWRVFRDACEMAAIAISNRVDLAQREVRETRYLTLAKAYTRSEMTEFAHIFADITDALEATGKPEDVLGGIFQELELQNHWKGQFFSPPGLCELMARMQVDNDGMRRLVAHRGFFRAAEPTCGAGGMILALAHAAIDAGLKPHRHLHVWGGDVDDLCVHMTYIQCSLWHIPAMIQHANTLSGETWSTWYTPAHILGLWSAKLRRAESEDDTPWDALPLAERLRRCQDVGLLPSAALEPVAAAEAADA